jgi:hypothetical protein
MAFLNESIEENVYMKQPKGFCFDKSDQLVCKLNKSIYASRQ